MGVAARAGVGSESGELKRQGAHSGRDAVTQADASVPRVLFEVEAYRIVIVERPIDSTGVLGEVAVVEIAAEGTDAMGHTRWYELVVKDDKFGSRHLARVVQAMGAEIAKGKR
jgi:hypothetical protein